MTDEGIFLGGGNVAGTFKDWTIPEFGSNNWTYNLYRWSLGAKGGGNPDNWGTWGSTGISLASANNYVGHVNTSGKFYPKHYIVEYWIKYK